MVMAWHGKNWVDWLCLFAVMLDTTAAVWNSGNTEKLVAGPWYPAAWCGAWVYSAVRLITMVDDAYATWLTPIDAVVSSVQLVQIYSHFTEPMAGGLLFLTCLNTAAFAAKFSDTAAAAFRMAQAQQVEEASYALAAIVIAARAQAAAAPRATLLS